MPTHINSSDVKPLIGAHINSELDELINKAKIIKKNGGNIVQLFANKISKKAKKYYNDFFLYLQSVNMKCVVHSSYTINIAQNWDFHSWWLKQLISEIQIANSINAIGVVLHLGKQLNISKEVAINNTYTSLQYVLSKTKHYNIPIFLETSSGQGSEMFSNIEDFGIFFKKIKKITNNVGICIDTCHIFSAGYDIRGKSNITKFLKLFDSSIGLENVKLIHLNDSKNELGSKIDRHANYSKGYSGDISDISNIGDIGIKSIKIFANFFKNLEVPIILETPVDNVINDLINVLD